MHFSEDWAERERMDSRVVRMDEGLYVHHSSKPYPGLWAAVACWELDLAGVEAHNCVLGCWAFH